MARIPKLDPLAQMTRSRDRYCIAYRTLVKQHREACTRIAVLTLKLRSVEAATDLTTARRRAIV